jgi:hypothetical protein
MYQLVLLKFQMSTKMIEIVPDLVLEMLNVLEKKSF